MLRMKECAAASLQNGVLIHQQTSQRYQLPIKSPPSSCLEVSGTCTGAKQDGSAGCSAWFRIAAFDITAFVFLFGFQKQYRVLQEMILKTVREAIYINVKCTLLQRPAIKPLSCCTSNLLEVACHLVYIYNTASNKAS